MLSQDLWLISKVRRSAASLVVWPACCPCRLPCVADPVQLNFVADVVDVCALPPGARTDSLHWLVQLPCDDDFRR